MRLTILAVALMAILLTIPAISVGAQAKTLGGNATDLRDYITHAPIRINSNSEFASLAASEGWPGDGSAANPYIIQNYNINASGYGVGIFIGNTTVHFIIQNSVIHDADFKGLYGIGAGIQLLNVTYGIILNNTITGNANHGIYMDYVTYTRITDNRIEWNNWGIFGGILRYSRIDNNSVIDNPNGGIVIGSRSSSNTLDYNFVYDCGYGIDIQDSSSIVAYNNTVDGDNKAYIGTRIYNSTSVTFRNNTVQGNKYGVYVEKGSSNKVLGNVILRNSGYGIIIEGSSSNTIYENELFYNHGSGDSFDPSHVQALDNGTSNVWYSSATNRGNYWHDWANNNNTNDQDHNGIVDWAYHIDGTAGASDPYPLKKSNYEIPEFNSAFILLAIIFAIGAALRRKNSGE